MTGIAAITAVIQAGLTLINPAIVRNADMTCGMNLKLSPLACAMAKKPKSLLYPKSTNIKMYVMLLYRQEVNNV